MKLVKRIKRNFSPACLTTFVNPYSYLVLRNKKDIYTEFDQILIDGTLLIRILRLLGKGKYERVSFDMTSLAKEIFEKANNSGATMFLLGSKPEHLESTLNNIESQYPNVKIIGSRSGYFVNDSERQKSIENITLLKPSIVICGMGTPIQEQYLIDLKNSAWEGQAFTCGGFIHQTANGITYYPKLVDRLNIRWLYRIYDEPILVIRYFFWYPISVFLFVFDIYFSRANRSLTE